MRKSVFAVSRRAVRILKAMLIPGLALFLALVPAAVVNLAMPAPVSAAIELRASSTGTTYNTDLTIDKPTGVVAGDVMIVNVAQVGNHTTAPLLVGWELIDGSDLSGLSERYGALLYRVADGTEGLSFTFKLGAGTNGAVGSIVAFSGVDTSGTDPFDVPPGTISVQPDQTAVMATSITTASANAAVIMFGMAANAAPDWSGWATTSLGALTELYDNQVGGSNAASVGAAWAIKDTAGVTGAGAAMLSFAERNGGILIALKPVKPTTLTLTPAAGTYGDTASLTATLSPAVAGKTISFTLNGVSAGTAVTDGSGVANIPAASLAGIDHGTYPAGVGASYAGEADYSASDSTASLTVNLRDIVVSADNNGKVYGNADPGLTYHMSSGSLAAGDAFSGNIARAAGEDAGTYAIQQGTLALNSNYSLSFVNGTFTISARDIEVTANNSSKVYGDPDPALTHHISSGSLAAGDAFSGELTREAGEDVGTYAIQQGTLALSGNYNLAFVEGTFTIRASDSEEPSPPTVDSVSPQSGQPGDTLDVVINGNNFTEATAVDFGRGVTVNSFKVQSPIRIVANLTIDPAAEAGENKIVVTAPSGDGQLPGAFAIGLSGEVAKAGRARGLWLILILALLAIALGFLLFTWFKRRKKRVDPELAPILAPSRPLGGTLEAVEPARAQAADLEETLGEAGKAADPEQAPTMTVSQPLEETEKTADVPQAAAAVVSRPRRRTTKKKTTTSTSSQPRKRTTKKKQASG